MGAVTGKKGIVIAASADGIDNLAGHIAAAANHEERQLRQRLLDCVHDRLMRLLGV